MAELELELEDEQQDDAASVTPPSRALYHACANGRLGEAQRLWSLRATNNLTLNDFVAAGVCQISAFAAACKGGHLEIACWIREMGAVETPHELSSLFDKICEVGDKKDVARMWRVFGAAALRIAAARCVACACVSGRFEFAKWLWALLKKAGC